MDGWLETQWLEDGGKKPVKNQELWQKLDALCQKHQTEWRWVKGHSGHTENEIVDQLANEAMDEMENH